jgi:hypothetical protein
MLFRRLSPRGRAEPMSVRKRTDYPSQARAALQNHNCAHGKDLCEPLKW